MIERLTQWLGAPRDAAALAAFRVAFGLLVAVSAARFLAYDWVKPLFSNQFRFHYWGFAWVPSPGLEGVYALFAALIVLGLCVALGLFYRASIVLLFIAFTWLQLLDVSNYLNHYYLVSLLAFLMCFMPLHRFASVDTWREPGLRAETLPAWCTVLLTFQVGLVYFFAGLAKFNTDWLVHAAPLRLWLAARTDLPLVGTFLDAPFVAWAMSWGGFLFDTSAPFFLAWKRTRLIAYGVVIVFHTATRALFPIGMFPFIMTLCALIFFDASWPRRWVPLSSTIAAPAAGTFPRWALVPLGLWCAVQVALPLRAHAYGGDVSWHEQGMRFSWRVMTREKNGSVTLIVKQPSTGREWHVSPSTHLSRVQERELSVQPDLILQWAHHVGREWERAGHPSVEVFADTWVSLNGRPAAPLVDARMNLMAVNDSLADAHWVLPVDASRPLGAREPFLTLVQVALRLKP